MLEADFCFLYGSFGGLVKDTGPPFSKPSPKRTGPEGKPFWWTTKEFTTFCDNRGNARAAVPGGLSIYKVSKDGA